MPIPEEVTLLFNSVVSALLALPKQLYVHSLRWTFSGIFMKRKGMAKKSEQPLCDRESLRVEIFGLKSQIHNLLKLFTVASVPTL